MVYGLSQRNGNKSGKKRVSVGYSMFYRNPAFSPWRLFSYDGPECLLSESDFNTSIVYGRKTVFVLKCIISNTFIKLYPNQNSSI